jgi:hypothetical protein
MAPRERLLRRIVYDVTEALKGRSSRGIIHGCSVQRLPK